MGINVIEHAEIWSTVLDQQAVQQATSGWMEANSTQVTYVGGKKVRIPEMYTTGLGDYQRGTGSSNPGKYAKGSVRVEYRDYTLEMDRSTQIEWDRHDVDESGFIVQAPIISAKLQRERTIPEIDSYRYSKIAQEVMSQGAGSYASETLTAENIFIKFLAQIRAMQNITGIDTSNLVATMPFSVWSILEAGIAGKGSVGIDNFTRGNVNFQVNTINGIPIIPVVEDRMKTAYIFHPGHGDNDELGFEPAPGAKTINWIITPRDLPIAISKTDILKVWTPDQNINSDDWVLQYRKYHDLWIMFNQLNQIVLSIQP